MFGYDVLDAGGKDALEEALNAPNSVCFILCNTETTNTPTGYTYSCGLVFKRDSTHVWVMLFKYVSTNIAINCYTSSAWSGWKEIVSN